MVIEVSPVISITVVASGIPSGGTIAAESPLLK